MARHPEWFERLDSITSAVRDAAIEDFGRREVRAVFGCSERDSIRLLHKFGATVRQDALSLPRPALLAQLEAVARSAAYGNFQRQRNQVAEHLRSARAEAAARQFRVRPAQPAAPAPSLDALPPSISWRRGAAGGPGRFEILYEDGADLMWQLSEFLAAAGVNREEFLRATEPADASL